jgi:hypothetical protein
MSLGLNMSHIGNLASLEALLGSMDTYLGAIYTHPGTTKAHPEATKALPGAIETRPGVMRPEHVGAKLSLLPGGSSLLEPLKLTL